MKRMIPLILALLLLAACGAEPAEATPTAVLATPTPAPMPSASPLPDYIPPMDFEPVSVWQAEPFGADGYALLYLGGETDGAIPFKLFSVGKTYFYWNDGVGSVRSLDCRSFSGNFSAGDGCYTFEAACDSGSDERYSQYLMEAACVGEVSGSADIAGNVLTMSYTSALPYVEGTVMEAYLDSAAPHVVCRWNEDDPDPIELYLPYSFTKMPEEQLGSAMYQMPAFVEEIGAGGFRGIDVGSSLIDILSRVPRNDEHSYLDGLRSDALSIYGAGSMNWFSTLITPETDGAYVVSVQAFDIISYRLDEGFRVESVEYYQQTFRDEVA